MIFWSLYFLIQSTDLCSWKIQSSDMAQLTISGGQIEIPTMGSHPKLVRCGKSAIDPQVILAEINLGDAGTTSITSPVHLFVFRVSENKVQKLFEHYLGESTKPKNFLAYQLRSKGKKIELVIGPEPQSASTSKLESKTYLLD